MSTRPAEVRTPLAKAKAIALPAIGAVAALSFFVNLLVFVAPLYSLQVYDRVLTSRSGATLVMLSLIAAFLFIATSVIEHFRARALVHVSVRVEETLAEPAFDGALAAARLQKGGRHAQYLRDVESLREFVGGGAIIALLDAPWSPIFLAVCFIFHPLIGALATAGLVALLGLTVLNERITKNALIESSVLSISAIDKLSASLRNAEAIYGLGMASAIRRQWGERHIVALSRTLEAYGRGAAIVGATKLLRLMLQSGMLGLGAWLSIRQEISPGIMIAASLVMGRALAPVEGVVGQWKSIVGALSAAKRLAQLFAAFPAEAEPMAFPTPDAKLVVEALGVAAPGTSNALIHNVSLQLEPGDTLAIVGKSGCGKSTLARALVGAWPATVGTIRLDGYKITHFGRDQLGSLLGYLPQDVELFAGTVRDNICRFKDDVTDEAVIAAALAAGAHEVIQRLPNGYATAIGEGGSGLSGGQRQRIGLARAMFGEPILVVLDEPDSNLDGDGEVSLLNAVLALKTRRATTVIVTHKPEILMACDKVAVMNNGTIVKFGRRDEMIPHVMRADTAAIAKPRPGEPPRPVAAHRAVA